MSRKPFQIAWVMTALLAISLACNLTSGLGDRIGAAKGTAEFVATEIKQGRVLLGTARALATEVGSTGLLETAQSLATVAGESGLLETAQAFATDQGAALIETAQSFATEEAPGLAATAQAVATQLAAGFGEPPPDIPVVGGDKENFYASDTNVSYAIGIPYDEALDFYLREMPANGWQFIENDTVITDGAAILNSSLNRHPWPSSALQPIPRSWGTRCCAT